METGSATVAVDPSELATEDLEALIDACGRELYRRQQQRHDPR